MKRFPAASAAILLMMLTWGHQALADPQPRPHDGPDSRRVYPPGKRAETERRHVPGHYSRPRYYVYYPPYYGYHPAPLHRRPRPNPWPRPHRRWPSYYERYYYAPLYIPAGELYGPQATARFLGWDVFNRRAADVNPIVPRENAQRRQEAPKQAEAEREPQLRGTNPQAVALAWKFIGFGDAHFADQKYTDALQRYRKALQAAPQLAEGYFRQGYALAAMARYELAAKALKRGLALDPAWPTSGFHNDELYGRDQAAKNVQMDALAKAADGQPHDADLMFLLGVYLHFDGQPARAAVFFGRAAQLVGGDDAHLRAFVGK
ncbi:MAG: tetratricopeptide repeat protein [Planctomycetota bacterium]|jgi:tetratricopeptide (TPR) repeat protein